MDAIRAISANTCVSVSDLKKNPSAVIEAAGASPVAILNHNRPVGYLVSIEHFELMLEALDDAQLASIAKRRMGGATIKTSIGQLRKQPTKSTK